VPASHPYEILHRARRIWETFDDTRPIDDVVAEIFERSPRSRKVVESRHSPVLTHEFFAEASGRMYLVVAVVIEQPALMGEVWQLHGVYPVLSDRV